MKITSPKVSLVVPVFNETVLVMEQSLSSVASQSFGDFECLVIDESTDPAAAEACRAFCEKDARFRYIHPDRRLGLAASLNLGISMARGNLIARFDSDDVCLADRLESQVEFMNDHPEVGVLGGGLEIIDEAGETLAFRDYPVDHATIERQFQTANSIAHPTVMIRKDIIEEFGGYDPSFRFAEDLDLWLRLLNRGVRFENLQQILVRYRQQNTTRQFDNWRFNLRARIRNFSIRLMPWRVLGICAIAAWGFVPTSIQERVFHVLRFRRN